MQEWPSTFLWQPKAGEREQREKETGGRKGGGGGGGLGGGREEEKERKDGKEQGDRVRGSGKREREMKGGGLKFCPCLFMASV